MDKTYKVTNYGNTRTVYIRGQSWEITKGATIEVATVNASEVAAAFDMLPFVDVEVVEQPVVESSKKEKKISKHKKKVTTVNRKKIKRRKVKRRITK